MQRNCLCNQQPAACCVAFHLTLFFCYRRAFLDPYAQFARFSDGNGALDLEEFMDAKDVVTSLSKEYEACERADYVSGAACVSSQYVGCGSFVTCFVPVAGTCAGIFAIAAPHIVLCAYLCLLADPVRVLSSGGCHGSCWAAAHLAEAQAAASTAPTHCLPRQQGHALKCGPASSTSVPCMVCCWRLDWGDAGMAVAGCTSTGTARRQVAQRL